MLEDSAALCPQLTFAVFAIQLKVSSIVLCLNYTL